MSKTGQIGLDAFAELSRKSKPIEFIRNFLPDVWAEIVMGREKGVSLQIICDWIYASRGVKISKAGLYYALKRGQAEGESR